MKFSFRKISSSFDNNVNLFFIADTKQLPSILKGESENINKTLKLFNNFSAKYGEILITTVFIDGNVKKFAFCGIGNIKKLTKVKTQELGGIITDKLNSLKITKVSIIVDNEELENQSNTFILNIAEGIKLKNYCFNKYFEDKKDKHKIYLKKVQFYVNSSNIANAFSEREKIVDATHFVRDLVSEPGNALTPEAFVEVCEELKELGIRVKVLDKKQLKLLGMHALLAVGQGSHHGSYVVTMEWNGTQSNKDETPIAFVGKGVTFDTGGINLKPSGPSITLMKYDMGGAGVVTGLMKSLALRKAKVNVIGAIGLAENMPSGHAQRPGDVITSMSGQTIEVDNTDAEGRLLLADVMWHVQESFKPKVMIDLATLTGAIIAALGDYNAGLFSNSDRLANQLTKAGMEVGERVWRLPLDEYYDKLINSNIADIRNVGKRGAGSITAAQFLQRFVQKGCSWAHIDIAGVNWLDNGNKLSPKGATGYGVRLLNEFLIQNYEEK